jgi:hypothetical protein
MSLTRVTKRLAKRTRESRKTKRNKIEDLGRKKISPRRKTHLTQSWSTQSRSLKETLLPTRMTKLSKMKIKINKNNKKFNGRLSS